MLSILKKTRINAPTRRTVRIDFVLILLFKQLKNSFLVQKISQAQASPTSFAIKIVNRHRRHPKRAIVILFLKKSRKSQCFRLFVYKIYEHRFVVGIDRESQRCKRLEKPKRKVKTETKIPARKVKIHALSEHVTRIVLRPSAPAAPGRSSQPFFRVSRLILLQTRDRAAETIFLMVARRSGHFYLTDLFYRQLTLLEQRRPGETCQRRKSNKAKDETTEELVRQGELFVNLPKSPPPIAVRPPSLKPASSPTGPPRQVPIKAPAIG